MSAPEPRDPPVFEHHGDPHDESEEEGGVDPWAFLAAYWRHLVIPTGLVLSPLVYMALARPLPAVALFVCSMLVLASLAALVFVLAPMGYKITLSRRLEVLGYRVVGSLGLYLALGYAVILAANAYSPQVVPADWPQTVRFVPFWPFYLWVVLGCGGTPLFPCPPPPG